MNIRRRGYARSLRKLHGVKDKKEYCIRHLGVDFIAVGQKRRRKLLAKLTNQQVRQTIAKRRLPRIMRVAKVAVGARKLFATGLLPSLICGCVVTGTSDILTKSWRHMAAKAWGHPNVSKDIWGHICVHLDPLPTIGVQPLKRFCEEYWAANSSEHRRARADGIMCRGLGVHELTQCWRAAIRNAEDGYLPCGPLGHAIRQLKWSSWSLGPGVSLCDRLGNVIDPKVVCPKSVAFPSCVP